MIITYYWGDESKFCNILVRATLQCVYHVAEAVQAVMSTSCQLVVSRWFVRWHIVHCFHSVCDLKATQIYAQHSVTRWVRHLAETMWFITFKTSARLNHLRAIGLNRVFGNGPGDRGSIPGRVIPKTQKMVLDVALLSTQHYKLRIKGKLEKSREWSCALLYTSVL